MKKVILLYSGANGQLVGVFSSRMTAKDFAEEHQMFAGWFCEELELDNPTIMLKDGTY